LSLLNPLKLSPFKSKARGETEEEREDREDQERAKKEWEDRQVAAAMAKNLPLHLQWLGLEEEGVAHESDGVPADAPDRAATELSSSDGAATELSSSSPALRERLIVWGLATGRGKGAHEETIRTWEGV